MLTSLVLGGLHQRSGVALPTGGRADPAVGNEALALLILVLVFIVLVSPPHQVRTAADTASEDNSFFIVSLFTWELVPFFYFFSTYYTPMEVVPPVGMLVYIAVYTLAADVLLLIHPRTAVCFNVG